MDPIERLANAARAFGVMAVDLVVRFFSIALAASAWVGAAFLKDLLWPEKDPAWWMAPLGVAIIVAGIGSLAIQTRDSSVNHQMREKVKLLSEAIKSFGDDYRDIWTFVLYRWSKELTHTGNHRISIYKHEDAEFVMIARYSSNATIGKRGRAIYPDDEGCIGSAWKSGTGTCFTNEFPNFDTQPARYRNRHLNQWRLPQIAADGLTMKSRAIYAIAVEAPNGLRHAVVVFESLDRDGLDVAAIDAFMSQNGVDEVNRWMAATKNHLPSLELAKREGL